ncbi:MAG: cobalt ECF transporter T component CbiQ [Chlorobium sp.]|uniref:cobalt ECF transporter T component CbiQ n=1 Tax=Chlorobium sp. TaxID=1095 RepID=UPI0025C0D2CB|nr:cobalt ECF transporter T component CbiQ [Chlorobium sp.]MCF8383027.1 cobalt ECF transporter T component CbiQ [Chlorobium sp.]
MSFGTATKQRDAPEVPGNLPAGDMAALGILILFIMFVVSVPKHNLAAVIAYGSFPLFLITAAGIPLRPIVKRLLGLSPFVLFMAAGNLYFDRHPFSTAGSLTITGGMVSGSVIIAKTFVTLGAMHAYSLCMPFHRFGSALRSFGVPEVFVTQLQLVYRYSSLLVREARSLRKARDLRSFGGRGNDLFNTAQLIGSLLLRTASRAERIYLAMCARGFRNSLSLEQRTPFTATDAVAVTTALICFTAVKLLFAA